MLKLNRQKTLNIFLGLVVILLGSTRVTEAFPHLNKNGSSLRCQTTCHKSENIARAQREKLQAPRCKSCHVGMPARKTPFTPLSHFRPVSTSSAPASRVAAAKKTPPTSAGKTDSSVKIPAMALVPKGEFIMGSNERWEDESPEHISETGAFYLDINEVSNQDYKNFTDATKRETPYHWPEGKLPKGKENHPVVYVNWFDAHDYCAWPKKRLPTEQEWEKAARGENGLIYPWGNLWSLDKSNNPYKESTGTQPVGTYPDGQSPYGVNDLSGNVWEWVDAYYLPHPGNNSLRPEYGKDKRVLKGGSWFDCLSYGCGLSAPTFNRSFFTPEVRNNSFGFRCAKSP